MPESTKHDGTTFAQENGHFLALENTPAVSRANMTQRTVDKATFRQSVNFGVDRVLFNTMGALRLKFTIDLVITVRLLLMEACH